MIGLRRLLVVLVLLACAAPAQAAPRSLAYSQFGVRSALAGDLALFTRGSGAYAVPTAGGPARRIFFFAAEAEVPRLAASPTRAAISVERDERIQVFSGPPSGPWAELDRAGSAVGLQVDGDRLYTFSFGTTIETSSITVRDPDPHTVPFPAGRDAIGADFAGDLVAYETGNRLIVRDWRTGAQRTAAKLPDDFVASIDLRDDGRAVVATDEGELFDVPPGGVARRLARNAGKPRFAGEHIVFVRGPGPSGVGALRVIDPSGRVRAFGVPTTRLGDFTTDGSRVLWEANGCLMIAPVTDPIARAPGPGPCPRGELTRVDGPNPRLARAIPVTLRCVAAPRTCRGTLQLKAEGLLNAPRRFAIPAGRARRFAVRLSERGYRALSRLVASDDGALVTIHARIDGHRVRPSGPDILVEP